MDDLDEFLATVRACQICSDDLPLGPRPIVQVARGARILVVGQAPGRRVHESGIPWDDPSGERLREWMGVEDEVFYDASKIALLPMGFCYPGTGRSGDLPPRSECAPAWREQILSELDDLQLIIVIGQYAQRYHLPDAEKTVTQTVRNWRTFWPETVPLPHPSPRNNIWLAKNPWFEERLLPDLRQRVSSVLAH